MAFSENFNLIQKVLTNLFYFFFSKCRRVPKMSCKIEKRTVVKTKPESKCSRVPRQFCRKEDCSQKDVDENLYNNDPNCYYRNQIVSCFFHIHFWPRVELCSRSSVLSCCRLHHQTFFLTARWKSLQQWPKLLLHTLCKNPEIWAGQNRSPIFWYVVLIMQ